MSDSEKHMSDSERQKIDGGKSFGRFSDEDFDGIREGNGKIPWWLVMITVITVLEAFLWTMPWGFGQRYETVTTTFVSTTGKQPWWDWGYMMIFFQIIIIMSGITAVIWTINAKTKPKSRD